MQKNKTIRFVESLILLPFMTMSMPLGGILQSGLNIVSTPQILSSKTEYMQAPNIAFLDQALENKAKILELQGEAIDRYFRARRMPLAGTGQKMALEAEKNGLDWRLLPAIAIRESTGGIYACKKVPHSFFGWGSCKIGFETDEQAIEAVARNLGGNDKDTDHHYAGKNIVEILNKYNSVIPNYGGQVMKIMDKIGDKEISISVDTSTKNGT
jgi:hypothetical protein